MKEEKDTLHLFEGFGIELEYMLADRKTLKVLPLADRVLEKAAGELSGEIRYQGLGWSNELVLHVLEMKTPGPAADLKTLPDLFGRGVAAANKILESEGGVLLPTAMHPFFKPHEETRLWPHDNKEIYECYHRIFDCRGHGWSNLQSMHINLPFCGDEEFASLHAAIRLTLPLLPALAASSPFVEGQLSGLWDSRLNFYRQNQARIPVIAGDLIPEPVFSKKDYENQIYAPIQRAIAPFDPEGILEPVWLNSRGAIARFDRGAIEIRVMDLQECPKADLALAAFTISLLKSFTQQYWLDLSRQKRFDTLKLKEIFITALTRGETGVTEDRDYLELFRFPERGKAKLSDLLQHLFEVMSQSDPELHFWKPVLGSLIQRGSLSSSLKRAYEKNPGPDTLLRLYQELSQCLAENRLFHA